ncbi:MAG: YbaN family protein [Clostridiales bacterium]|jgi:uncharacterized membrane protein YbaN (DUF454 family)|nr:YbaN family protein [Clostridiales bacterium]
MKKHIIITSGIQGEDKSSENTLNENSKPNTLRSTLKRVFLITAGLLSLSAGAVGIALPILPTTPFVILAAACFGMSSPRLYHWLANTKYFGEYIRHYREKSVISAQARRTGIAALWLMLSISAIVFRRPLVWLILGLVGVSVTAHILLIGRGGNKGR